MGWSSQATFSTYVVIEGSNDGLFVYNGTPAAGNLIASISFAAGTDPYGNPYRAGFESQIGSSVFAQLATGVLAFGSLSGSTTTVTGASVSFQDSAAASAQPILGLVGPSANTNNPEVFLFGESQDGTKPAQVAISPVLGSITPTTTALLEVQGAVSVTSGGAHVVGSQTLIQSASAAASTNALLEVKGQSTTDALYVATADLPAGAAPAAPTGAENWHTISPSNSWSNSTPALQYRYLASPPNTVEVIGDITHVSISGSSIIGTLPAGYRPAHQQPWPLSYVAATAGWTTGATWPPRLRLDTSGNLTLLDLPAGTTEVIFHAFYSLDA